MNILHKDGEVVGVEDTFEGGTIQRWFGNKPDEYESVSVEGPIAERLTDPNDALQPFNLEVKNDAIVVPKQVDQDTDTLKVTI